MLLEFIRNSRLKRLCHFNEFVLRPQLTCVLFSVLPVCASAGVEQRVPVLVLPWQREWPNFSSGPYLTSLKGNMLRPYAISVGCMSTHVGWLGWCRHSGTCIKTHSLSSPKWAWFSFMAKLFSLQMLLYMQAEFSIMREYKIAVVKKTYSRKYVAVYYRFGN